VNPSDVKDSWVVREADIRRLVETARKEGRRVWAFESSMANCYGLGVLHRFITLPYLSARAKALEAELVRVRGVAAAAEEQFQSQIEEEDYVQHVKMLREKQIDIRKGTAGYVLDGRSFFSHYRLSPSRGPTAGLKLEHSGITPTPSPTRPKKTRQPSPPPSSGRRGHKHRERTREGSRKQSHRSSRRPRREDPLSSISCESPPLDVPPVDGEFRGVWRLLLTTSFRS
jgi:hypothetical protein